MHAEQQRPLQIGVDLAVGGTIPPGCAQRPVTNGVAGCVTTLTTPGPTTLTAAYSGDTALTPATATTPLTVTRATFTQSLLGALLRLAALLKLPGY